MKKAMSLSLRANEKIYINGAILKFPHKVTLEILNDATFLLETHVIQPEQTTTPLRQIYFVIQTMLMDPGSAGMTRLLFERMLASTASSFEDAEVLGGLNHIDKLIGEDRYYEALKQLRGLFSVEAGILASSGQALGAKLSNMPPEMAMPAMRSASTVLAPRAA
ncbi:flagellar biosynthesis repressor FlbT [Bosea sp. BH3]|nr:flagellar biosynthesis repressor FlbT [Bosea sp. BH3]